MTRSFGSALTPFSILSSITVLSGQALAFQDVDNLNEVLTNGKTTLDFRYRLENVDQAGFDKDATASTLRSKLKYTTASVGGLSATAEFEHSFVLGSTTYNNTINGKTQYPVIADPASTELNQAYLTYKGEKGLVQVGRQGVNLDNQRFVGTVGWRQNDQTYDAVVMNTTAVQNLSLTYGFVWNVNRIFSNKHPAGNLDTATHVFNAKYTGFKGGAITAYGLMIDLHDGPAVDALSSKTYGVRVNGSVDAGTGKFGYDFDFATQSDHGDNPIDYSASYIAAQGSYSASGFTAGIGYEKLGSDDGVFSFKTPLATLHKFNGWSDQFLATPTGGLEDKYASLAYKVSGDSAMKGTLFKVIYHDFKADHGGVDYGSEWNWLISKKIGQFAVSLKGAHYNADTFKVDADKVWFTVATKF